jgi:hypothetical protein
MRVLTAGAATAPAEAPDSHSLSAKQITAAKINIAGPLSPKPARRCSRHLTRLELDYGQPRRDGSIQPKSAKICRTPENIPDPCCHTWRGEAWQGVAGGALALPHHHPPNSPVTKSGFQFVFVAMAITRAAGSPSMTAIRAKVRAVSVRRTRTMALRTSAACFGVPFP